MGVDCFDPDTAHPVVNNWLHSSHDGITLTLHIQPGAKKTEIGGVHGDALKIRLNAPPVDGRANAALIDFLATLFKISKSRISLKSGQTSRRKVLVVEGMTVDAAIQLFLNQH